MPKSQDRISAIDGYPRLLTICVTSRLQYAAVKEHCDVAINTGMKLGLYEVLAQLGAGAMGWVYRARDTRLDRLVAIKVALASQSADERSLDRLQREARAISV